MFTPVSCPRANRIAQFKSSFVRPRWLSISSLLATLPVAVKFILDLQLLLLKVKYLHGQRLFAVSLFRIPLLCSPVAGKGHVLPSTAPDSYSFRLSAATAASPPLAALPLSTLGYFVRIQAFAPLPRPCYRPAEIRLTLLSDYLNPLNLPPVHFQMAASPELRHLRPHIKFQGLHATTGSPLPMYAGLRLALCN